MASSSLSLSKVAERTTHFCSVFFSCCRSVFKKWNENVFASLHKNNARRNFQGSCSNISLGIENSERMMNVFYILNGLELLVSRVKSVKNRRLRWEHRNHRLPQRELYWTRLSFFFSALDAITINTVVEYVHAIVNRNECRQSVVSSCSDVFCAWPVKQREQ